MFSGIRIYSSDIVWRRILADLNATVLDAPDMTAVNLDDIEIPPHCGLVRLKSLVLGANDNSDIIRRVFGENVALSPLQRQIIVLLYKSAGMTGTELKAALGYAPDATTHTVDTAIYQMRRTHGRDLIQNDGGVYKIGRI